MASDTFGTDVAYLQSSRLTFTFCSWLAVLFQLTFTWPEKVRFVLTTVSRLLEGSYLIPDPDTSESRTCSSVSRQVWIIHWSSGVRFVMCLYRYQRVQRGRTVSDRSADGVHDQRANRRRLHSHLSLHILRDHSHHLPCFHTKGTVDFLSISSLFANINNLT